MNRPGVSGARWERRDAASCGQARSGTVIAAASVPLTCVNVLEQRSRRSDPSVVVLDVGISGVSSRCNDTHSADVLISGQPRKHSFPIRPSQTGAVGFPCSVETHPRAP
jgi:hypothetical protein